MIENKAKTNDWAVTWAELMGDRYPDVALDESDDIEAAVETTF